MLFIILFCETGLVVTPFLPGDSLLFVAGALCALPGNGLSVTMVVLILIAAAIPGDMCTLSAGTSARSYSATPIHEYSNKVTSKRRTAFTRNTEAKQ